MVPNEEHKGAMRSVASQIWRPWPPASRCGSSRSANPAYPDGGQMRDLSMLDDGVDLVAWLVDNPHGERRLQHGSGTARSFKIWRRRWFKAAGRDPRIDYIDMPKALEDRYQYFTQARLERLRAAGYSRQMTPLEAGVDDYVAPLLLAARPLPVNAASTRSGRLRTLARIAILLGAILAARRR